MHIDKTLSERQNINMSLKEKNNNLATITGYKVNNTTGVYQNFDLQLRTTVVIFYQLV